MSNGNHSFDWEDLLFHVEDRSVIPIVGRELLVLRSTTGGSELLEHRLGRELAAKLQLTDGADFMHLSEVASKYLRDGGRRRKIYSGLRAIMHGLDLPLPEPLVQIAAIDHFSLYLSTTFDSLLEGALNEARAATGGRAIVHPFSGTGRTMPEIPTEIEHMIVPHVVQVFGRLSASPDYAVTEEDTLEFLHLWHENSDPGSVLIEQLRNNHLLFLGCGFPNWLSRFLIRTIGSERLLTRQLSEIVADSQVSRPANGEGQSLALFLKENSAETYEEGDAVAFVAELHRRWTERNPQGAEDGPEPRDADAEGAIFLSYASEDRTAVDNMARSLEAAGLEVWFDKKERSEKGDLSAGVAWDRVITKNIRRCALFLPFISKNSQRRTEGYFRKEWSLAIERSSRISADVAFLQPIVIDDTPDGAEHIPQEFWDRQVSRFAGGTPSREYVEARKKQIRKMQLQAMGRI